MSTAMHAAITGAALLLGPGIASAAASPAPPSGVMPERAISGQVVTTLEGSASAPEADAVITLAWIPGIATARMGDTLNIESLSSATSNKDGTFNLTVPNSPLLSKSAAENDGWLNFIIGVETSNGDSQAVDSAWNSNPSLTSSQNGKSATDNLIISFQYDESGQLLNGIAGTESIDQTEMAPLASAYGCQFIVDDTFTKYTAVMNTHSDSKSKVEYSYGKKANSDVDVGLKYYNSGWGVSGSAHVGNSRSAAQGHTKSGLWNAYVTAQFSYTKGHISDYFGAPTGSPCSTMSSLHVGDQKVNPGQWVGGLSENAGPGSERKLCSTSPRSNYKALLDYPGWFTLNSSTATKISAAVTTPYLTLGARSGYSTNTQMKWTTISAPGVTLCGQSGYPASGPGIVYVQNR